MKGAAAAAALVCAGAMLQGAYTYYQSSASATGWSINGSITNSSGVLTTTSNGSMISSLPVPDGTSDYEVKTTLTLTVSGGKFVHYLRASPNALSGVGEQGSFYAVELQNVTFTGSTCSATLAIYKRLNGGPTSLLSGALPVSCRTGMTMRSVMSGNSMTIFLDDNMTRYATDSSLPSGKPGLAAGRWVQGTASRSRRSGLWTELRPRPFRHSR